MRKTELFSSFVIKIVALLTMTLDHIGLFLQSLSNPSFTSLQVANIFRIFGRLAMPLFVFMIVEGVLHTKNIKKYFLRLGILAIFISVFLLLVTVIPTGQDVSSIAGAGNIFLDLILVAFTVYVLEKFKGVKKALILLPIVISLVSFFTKCYEFSSRNAVLWYPTFLYLQYDWISIALGLGFYFAKKISNSYIENLSEKQGIDRFVFDENGTTKMCEKLIGILFLMIVMVMQFVAGFSWPQAAYWDYTIELYAIISGALILFYNGKRGYNSKWFQYGCYLYYPLHLAIIFAIFILIS